MKPLVLFAHPAARHSRTNRLMFGAARQISGVTAVDLYSEYPRFDIDIDKEQSRLVAHDVVIFQFPLFWYSAPSIVKEWQDLVLEHGFAYGEHGRMLEGKPWLCALTAGTSEEAYTFGGRHHQPLRQLLSPMEATANLCRMPFVPPYVLFSSLSGDESARQAHVDGYVRLLTALRDDTFDFEVAHRLDHLSAERLQEELIR